MGLTLGGIFLVAPSGGAGVLDASWSVPTTNSDGSPLTDLASYRVYYGPAPACPGGAFWEVSSPTTSPGPDQTDSFRLTGLTSGALYFVSVTAVNLSGDESPCSSGTSAVAKVDFSVSPTGIVSFGDVNVGSFADQVFTVQNTRGGTVSGSASASAPFSIVSGSPFTLIGDGATQAVTVRFTPTASATVSNITFTVGDTISRLVTGTVLDVAGPTITVDGTGLDVARPTTTVAITSPTSNSTYSTGDPFLTLSGTASDDVEVTWVMWFNDGGASGMAIGTTNWTASGIVLHLGTNVLTVAAQNLTGYIATATLTVTLSVQFTFTDDSLIAGTLTTDPPLADPLLAASIPIKAIHFTELRDAINIIRLTCGLGTFAWTDPMLIPGITPINAIHLAELRTALNDAYLAVGRTPPTYTDPTAAAELIIKAVHLNELRAGVRALQ